MHKTLVKLLVLCPNLFKTPQKTKNKMPSSCALVLVLLVVASCQGSTVKHPEDEWSEDIAPKLGDSNHKLLSSVASLSDCCCLQHAEHLATRPIPTETLLHVAPNGAPAAIVPAAATRSLCGPGLHVHKVPLNYDSPLLNLCLSDCRFLN